MKFYEFILYWVSVARGYICRTPNNLQSCPCQGTASSGSQCCATAIKENAGKERKFKVRYRSLKIAFLIIIVLMCILMAVAQPLRVYALGFASETILELLLSSLAGTAAYAFLAAGGAELIVCILVGMGVSLTVSMIAGAINASVENGSWLDFVNNCQGKFTTKKAGPGVLTLAMAAAPLLGAYNWIKEHILGIKSDSSGGGTVEEWQELTTGTVLSNSTQSFNEYPENLIPSMNVGYRRSIFYGQKLFDSSNHDNSNSFTFYFPIDGSKLSWHISDYYLRSELNFSMYTFQFILNDDGVCTGVKSLFKGTQGSNSINSEIECNNINFYPGTKGWTNGNLRLLSDGAICSGDSSHLLQLIDKQGNVINKFNSIYDFTYKAFFESSKIMGYYAGETRIDTVPAFAESYKNLDKPSQSYENYYDAAKDLLSTTADSVNKKVAAGEITDETEGVIGVSVGSIASSGATEVSGSTSISSSVGVTDISSTVEGVNTMNMSNATVIGSNAMKSSFSSIGDKLPFSALKSISSFFNNTFSSKYSDSEVPVPVIPIKIDLPFLDKEFSFNIDFTPIKPYIGLIRASISVEFIIAMYLFYKKWLINKSSDG